MKNILLIKKKYVYLAAVLVMFIIGIFAYLLLAKNNKNPTGAVSLEPVSGEEIYPLFLCACCGQPLDKNNICCGMAEEMINYIDSLVNAGLSKNEIIIKTAEKYGINSIIEPKRAEIEAELAKRNPNLFPAEKLSFNQALGKKAPEFSLEGIDGKTVKLNDYKGKYVVLFFNEGSMCYPACWNQMAELGNDERFNTNNVAAFSIVVDQKSEWERIVKRVPQLSKAKILFDAVRSVSSAYDVLSLPSSMHPGSYPGHTYFIIDKEGIVRYTLDDKNMAVWNDKLASEI